MTFPEQYQTVLIFFLVGIGMIVAPMVLLAFLRPSRPDPIKAMPYECGMDPIGDAQVCFDMRFYTDALIFLVFEVEVVLLFPWARVFQHTPHQGVALIAGLIFILTLFLGLVDVWAKGDIEWVKSLAGTQNVRREEGVAPGVPAFEEPGTRAVSMSAEVMSAEVSSTAPMGAAEGEVS
jgi:NADH-quinone oxidoreductase subunit A